MGDSCLLIQQELSNREFVRWAGASGGYMVHIISHPTSCVIWYPVYSSETEFPPLLQIILADRSPPSELELDRQTDRCMGQDQAAPSQKAVPSFPSRWWLKGAALKVLSVSLSAPISHSQYLLPLPLVLGVGE